MKLSAPIFVLKKQAKELTREQSIPLNKALDIIAKKEGYNSWSLLQAKNEDPLPSSYGEILDFFNPGDLVLLGGRPAMGKTSFAMGLFVQAIQSIEAKHFLFTLDLTHQEIARRIAGYDESIGQNNERFFLDYSDDICADYIVHKAKDSVSKGSLVIVDYLQLLDQKRSHPPLQEQVKKLKQFAKEKECIIIFLSQVQRSIESRVDKRPKIDDVKLVNPLDLKLFNKALFLHKEAKQVGKVEVLFSRPKRHHLIISWDSKFHRFSN